MNDELNTVCFQFIVHRSYFIVSEECRGAWGALKSDGEARGAADVLHARAVFLHLALFGEPDQDLREDARGVRVGGRLDAVVHPLAFAASGHDARATQVCEVARNLRLARPQDLDEEADA